MANLRVALLLLVGLSCVAGLLPGAAPARGAAAGQQRAGAVTAMAGAAALAKKTTVLEGVKENMDGSALMFCVRSEGLRVNELNDLRMKLPEGVRLQCVKNTLVNIAAKDFEQFNAEGLDGLLHYSNYWFFATEAGMRDSIKVWKTFTEESGRKESGEIVGGIFDAQVLDGKGVEAVSKLPTKQELMGKTALLLKALPTKLARSLNEAGAVRIARGLEQARGQKMVRAVKAASEKLP